MTITENVLTGAAAGLTEVLWQGRRDGCFIAAQAGP